ncbi:MAG TPA: hypothetical protein EYP30_06000 [Archaeoglobaceae archaeon]|nr:hypothetical protein [Archaeoglobaceae archaeon]
MPKKRLTNFRVMNTTESMEKLFRMIDDFDCLFIDLPTNFEPYLRREELEEVAGVEYIQYVRILKPFLNLNLKLYCYKDAEHCMLANQNIIELAKLMLKAKFGKIEVEEWKRIIYEDIEAYRHFAEYEAIYIIERAKERNACINANERIMNILESEGFSVEEVWLSRFNRPIDRLYELVSMEIYGRKVSDCVYSEIIKEHIKFIDDVIEKGYEEAVRGE